MEKKLKEAIERSRKRISESKDLIKKSLEIVGVGVPELTERKIDAERSKAAPHRIK